MSDESEGARLRLKRQSGWFAAGQEVSCALQLLSDAAFKLFVWLCLHAERSRGAVSATPAELGRTLGKNEHDICLALEELERQGVCSVKAQGAIEIRDRFWPYRCNLELSPIFIAGILPRSGTNFLYQLLSEHPDCQVGGIRGGVDGVWSPDGKLVVLAGAFGQAPGVRTFFIQASDGSRTPPRSLDPRNDYFPTDWSSDGAALLYWESDNQNPTGHYSIYPLAANAKPYPLFEKLTSNVPDARFSPDGKWIAFSSDQSGRSEVYVAPFGTSGAAVQISTKGGQNVRWMPDGKHLLYLAPDYRVISIALKLGENAQAVEQHSLFQLPPTRNENGALCFDIAPDGKRLLLATPVGRTSVPITVLLNWQSELGKQVR